MNALYDNHANTFEYFPVKREKLKLEDLNEKELFELSIAISEKVKGLSELYDLTKNEQTFVKLSKAMGFKTAISVNMRMRSMDSYEKLVSRRKAQVKQIQALESTNKRHKEEIATLRHKQNVFNKFESLVQESLGEIDAFHLMHKAEKLVKGE